MSYLFSKIANLTSKEKDSWAEKIILSPLSFFSILYGQAVAMRLLLYSRGLIPIRSLPQKVISVGNLTLGGTGKTPLVIYLAKLLKNNSFLVSILSKGYKGKYTERVFVVADQERILATPEQSGDEPYLLAKNIPGIPVIVGKDRYLCGLYSFENFESEILILDDGFQFLSLKRDLNLLLLDATLPFGNGWLFPRGILREPVSQIERADAIILTKVSQSDNFLRLKEKLLNFKKELPIFAADYKPGEIWLEGGESYPPEFLKEKKIFAFCGIGRPQSFKETLLRLKPKELELEVFPDHYWYKKKDWQRLFAKAKEMNADLLLTTEKDWVRFKHFPSGPLPLGVLTIRHIFLNNDEINFKKFLFAKLDLDL